MPLASKPGVVAVETKGEMTVVRLERGAVVLDGRSRSLLEVPEASALDVVDPESVKNVLESGVVLARRHEEPVWWRRGATALDALSAPVLGVGLVRTPRGVLVLCGPRLVVARVAGAFDAVGMEVLHADHVAVQTASLRARHWGDIDPYEIWNVGFGVDIEVGRTQLAPERALVNLLEVTFSRPSESALHALSACAERIPHFSVTLPERLTDLERVVVEWTRWEKRGNKQ